MSERTCSACGSGTVEGFLLDRRKGLDARAQTWVEGTAETGFFGLRLRGRRKGDVVARRCRKCGHVDLWVPHTAE